MPIGLSINIGLNHVDPSHYQGWDGALAACEFDAQDLSNVAEQQGIAATTQILGNGATVAAVTTALSDAAARLVDGDFLFLTYSGHGGQLEDAGGDEDDGRDETWCLFDREFLDDELYALWSAFAPGVRIFVLSDSCHSGSVTRSTALRGRIRAAERSERIKAVPLDVEALTYRANRVLYDEVRNAHSEGDATPVRAQVLLISGCRDDQESADGGRNGLFTQNLLAVWQDGAFTGDYTAFHAAIVERMPAWQTPQLSLVGEQSPDFMNQRPFTI